MKSELSWSRNGLNITLEASHEESLQEKIINADGDIVPTGKMEIKASSTLKIYVDGNLYEATTADARGWWYPVEHGEAWRIKALKKVSFGAEKISEISSFLNTVIEDGTPEDVKVFRAEKKAREEKARAEAKARDAKLRSSGYCHKCGSFCYGDCEAF